MSLTGLCSKLLLRSLQHLFWLVEPLRGEACLGGVGHQDGPLEIIHGLGSSLLPGLLWTEIGLPPYLAPPYF